MTQVMADRRWVEAYIDIPFHERGAVRAGCDCWGLVALIWREQRGVILPDYTGVPPGMSIAVARAFLAERARDVWREVEAGAEQPFDIVLMRGAVEHEGSTHSRPVHCGLVVEPGRLIHIEAGCGVNVQDYRRHHSLKCRVSGFYRYVPA
jgi:cell wall-associated NlpC family hydrolase